MPVECDKQILSNVQLSSLAYIFTIESRMFFSNAGEKRYLGHFFMLSPSRSRYLNLCLYDLPVL